ncbi:MAG: DUF3592 domain-containing protein [Actinophytocola sp.]|nr:DUF3592 domain-containing protein [Actinophytocola sp.]
MTSHVRLPRSVLAKTPLVFGVLFLVVGVLLLASAVVTNVVRAGDWERRSAHTTGVVVDITTSTSKPRTSDGTTKRRTTTYCPVVEFTADGETQTFESDTCSDPGPRIGERLAVRYDPANPADATLGSWTARWLLVTILGGIGVLFSGLGALVLVLIRRGKLPGHGRIRA